MSNARVRAEARWWATSISRCVTTRPSISRIRTRPTKPCSIGVPTERRPLFCKSAPLGRGIFFAQARRQAACIIVPAASPWDHNAAGNGMTYESMLAETVAFRGHKGDIGEAYYARPLGGGPWPGLVLLHHLPGRDEWVQEAT